MIVVFGSLIADLVFPVVALPRPGETVASPNLMVIPGGKGANQAVAAARNGAGVEMAGCVGGDAFGEMLIAGLADGGVGTDRVARVASPTGCAAVCVDREGENQIAIAAGANLEARAAQVGKDILTPETTLVLQMEVRLDENWKLVKRARTAGARVVLNAAPASAVPARAMKSVDYLLVNEIESAMLARSAGLEANDSLGVARDLARRYSTACIVTLGGGGAVACLADGVWRIGALPIVAVDATAAGDAFVGVFAASLDGGGEVVEALHRASVAGGLACMTAGAQPSLPTAADIDRRLADLAPPERV
jgi:ribokinase